MRNLMAILGLLLLLGSVILMKDRQESVNTVAFKLVALNPSSEDFCEVGIACFRNPNIIIMREGHGFTGTKEFVLRYKQIYGWGECGDQFCVRQDGVIEMYIPHFKDRFALEKLGAGLALVLGLENMNGTNSHETLGHEFLHLITKKH